MVEIVIIIRMGMVVERWVCGFKVVVSSLFDYKEVRCGVNVFA